MMNQRRVGWIPVLFAIGILCYRADFTIADQLADAAEARDWDAVQRLLVQQKLNGGQADGMTALHWATFHGNRETARRLLDAGADPNVKNDYQITPLFIACELGHGAIASRLLENGAEVDATRDGSVTPLLMAARQGEVSVIKALLKHGASIDHRDRRGQTALMWAAAAGNADAIQALIDAGADLQVATDGGFDALMFGAREGHRDVVQVLVDAGMDVRAAMRPAKGGTRVPRKGTSPLLLAVESGHFELALELLDMGAEPNDQRSGFSPLHIVVRVRKPNRGEGTDGDPPPRGSGEISSLQFVSALIEAGADVNLRLERGRSGKAHLSHVGATPLLLAAKTADLPLIRLLVEHGADPLMPNQDGCTPLMACAGIGVRAVGEEAGTEEEVLETLEYLISLGADVNAVDKNKETAMHGAAYRCFPRVVAFLAQHGADPASWDHKNVSGWTPERIAQGYRPGSFKPSPETIQAIREARKSAITGR